MSLKMFFNRFWLIAAMVVALLFSPPVFANQIGITFTEGTIGGLGDYEKTVHVLVDEEGNVLQTLHFGVDVQAQRTDIFSLVTNGSIRYSFKSVGIQPFVSYNRNELVNMFDSGLLLNFNVAGLDIAAGASFRGANSTSGGLEKRFDANDNEVEVQSAGYGMRARAPNALKFSNSRAWSIGLLLIGNLCFLVFFVQGTN